MRRRLISVFLVPFLFVSAHAYDAVQLKKTITPESKSFAPESIALSPTGDLWVTDAAGGQLWRFSPAGEVLQRIGKRGIALGDLSDPAGVAIDAEGLVYVAERGNHRIQIFSPDGKALGAFGEKGASLGQLKSPSAIAVSADGVLAVAEEGASRLQLFSKDGVFLRSIEIGVPTDGVAFDAAGRLYVSHQKTKLVEVWSTAGQMLKTLTGAEPGVKGFEKPAALAVSASGLLYVADPGLSQFREMDEKGRTLGVFGRAGSGDGQFKGLGGIVVRDDTVFVADTRNRRLVVLTLSRPAPLPPLSPVPAARLQVRRKAVWPVTTDRIAWNNDGTAQTLSIARGEITTLDRDGKPLKTISLAKDLNIKAPSGLTTAPASGSLFIADSGTDRVVKTDREGKLLLEFGKTKGGGLSNPKGLACSPQGLLFVVDSGNARFQSFNHQGLFQFSGGEKGSRPGQLREPVAIAWDRERVFVADPGNKKVAAFHPSGRFLYEIGSFGPEGLVEPRQVAVDREGHLFVLDAARSRILAYDPQGAYIGAFGAPGKREGFFNKTRDFALREDGELHVVEEGRIQAFHVVLLPPAPTGLRATSGEGHVALKWEAVKTRFPARYLVYRSTPMSALEKVKETVETNVVDDSLTPNTTYSYTVVAQTVGGATSVPSAAAQAMARPLTSGPRLEILSATIDDVFSAHYKHYGRAPFGNVRIKNNGEAPVRKIKVSFAIQGYMDYPTELSIDELKSGEEKDVQLLATFNNRILEVSETTPIQAQLKLAYYNGDQEVVVSRHLPFKLYSRNTIRWDKKDRIAAFVTPNDPPVIDFARGVATPFAESHRGAPVPTPLLNAWSIFSGLGTYGITYLPRPNNPYDRVSLDSSTVDTVQFARETLARKSGDCADVVALLASALESMTVTTVALDAPGHLFLMFDTGVTRKAELGFPESMVVLYAGSYWIPIEATLLGSPFMEAWKQGAEQYRRWSKDKKVFPIDIHAAWKNFEPATLPDVASGAKPPAKEAVEEKFVADWKALVQLRWDTSVAAIKEEGKAGPPSGDTSLRLGLLAVEFKRYEEAKEFFMRARSDPATAASALNNLGNLAFLKLDYTNAEMYYTQALDKDPKDAQIAINLARLFVKQGKAKQAGEAFDKAIALDPSLREQFPDVSALQP